MLIPPKKVAIILGITLIVSIGLGFLTRVLVLGKTPKQLSTLSEIIAYAAHLPEFPASDDNDWTDPHYDTFDKSRGLSIWQNIKLKLNLLEPPVWSPQYLAMQLKKRTQKNQTMGLTDGPKDFIHIKASPETKILVFGDVHAAFHSLVRDLTYLKSIQIIDDNLSIKNGVYFVFNGDFIDRSPYSIDSLLLLLLLMEKNPQKVFYVAGNHERNSKWQDFGLKRELVARGYPYSRQVVPFKEEVNDFFNTLPESIYVSAADTTVNVLRMAFNDHLNLSYDEEIISPAFLEQKEPVKAYEFTTNSSTGPSIDVRAVIKTEEWRTSRRVKNGIGLLDQDHGATTWASLSSPINAHKIFLNLHEDSFIEVVIKDTIEKSIIFSHYQDPRTTEGFKQSPLRSLVFGGPPINIASHPSLKIASTMSLVRGVPSMGKQARRGLNLAINNFNLDTINNKYNIRFYIDNDDYLPQNARKNILEHVEDNIRIFLLPTGTPTLMSYLDIIQKKEIAVFFPITGATSLHRKDLTNIIHFRATYEEEVKALIKTLVRDYGALKFAFFYQDDSYGRGPFQEAIKQLAKFGITEFTALPYSRGAISFEKQVEHLKLSQADALGLFATATASEEFIRQLGADFLSNTQLFGISFVGELALRRFTQRLGMRLMLASPVPNPKTFNEPIGLMYREAMDMENNDYDVFSFEAFISSSLFFHALNQVDLKNITPEKALKAVEDFSHHDFYGFPLKFNPSTRSLARYIWIEDNTKKEWNKSPIYQ